MPRFPIRPYYVIQAFARSSEPEISRLELSRKHPAASLQEIFTIYLSNDDISGSVLPTVNVHNGYNTAKTWSIQSRSQFS